MSSDLLAMTEISEMSAISSELRSNFDSGLTRNLEFRRNQIKGLKRMFEENMDAWASALGLDLGKPRQESIMLEINANINTYQYILNDMDEWIRDVHVPRNLVTILDETFIHKDPYGLVLVMGAWNYPVQLTLGPVAGALAAGNCVVIKPSELSVHTADLMAKLINKYVDKRCARVVLGGIPETTELLKIRFDYIMFTGSSRVGRVVSLAASEHLTPCTLELGGKCPVYMDKSVDLRRAAKRILWGKMINLGQTCVAPDYILCDERTRDSFIEVAREVYSEFFGNSITQSKDGCRILNDRHYERITNILNESKGTQISFGQGLRDAKNRKMDLVLVKNVDYKSDSTMQEELFAPILPIITINSVEEAAKLINSGPKPLSLYIMTTKKKSQDYLIENTSSGSVCVNDIIVQLSVEALPFGGVGQSGHGRYHGKYTFDTFTHEKAVLRRDFGIIGETLGQARYPPYSEGKVEFLKKLVKNRKIFPNFVKKINFGFFIGIAVGFALSILLTRLQDSE